MGNLLLEACLTSEEVGEPESIQSAMPLPLLCVPLFSIIPQKALTTIHCKPAAISGVKYHPGRLSGTAVSVVMGLCVPVTLQIAPEQR